MESTRETDNSPRALMQRIDHLRTTPAYREWLEGWQLELDALTNTQSEYMRPHGYQHYTG